MRKPFLILNLLFFLTPLVGCGQIGPLYLPSNHPNVEKPIKPPPVEAPHVPTTF